MKVLAIDGALLNFGLVLATYENNQLTVIKTEHIEYERPKYNKSKADAAQVKKISKILRKYGRGVDLVIAELPHGSRSAQAAWSLGIALGIMGSLNKKIKWVTATEVKKYTGNKSKRDMINWACKKHPDIDWPTSHGRVMNKSEHICDALGVLYTGLGIKP